MLAVAVQAYVLGAMLSGVAEPQPLEQCAKRSGPTLRRRANSRNAIAENLVAAGGSNSSMRSSARVPAVADSPRLACCRLQPGTHLPSRYNSERIASTAVRLFGVSRKISLNTSSDSGPL